MHHKLVSQKLIWMQADELVDLLQSEHYACVHLHNWLFQVEVDMKCETPPMNFMWNTWMTVAVIYKWHSDHTDHFVRLLIDMNDEQSRCTFCSGKENQQCKGKSNFIDKKDVSLSSQQSWKVHRNKDCLLTEKHSYQDSTCHLTIWIKWFM